MKGGKRIRKYEDEQKKKLSRKGNGVDNTFAKKVYGKFDYDKVMRQLDDMISQTSNFRANPNFQHGYSIHAKLEISHPGDESEMQADEMADSFMHGNAKHTQHILSHHIPEVSRKGEGGGMETSNEFDQQLQGTKGQGQKLDESTKGELEEHMGADLSDVRIHDNAQSKEMSEEINAKAFTHGQDIYFGDGKFDTESEAGKKLLAHELTHTLQHKGNVKRKIQRSMKFEFQTENKIYAINNTGAPDQKLLPRKFGETSTTFDEDPHNEAGGDQPSYLAVGTHGGPARSAGNVFVEADAPLYMKEDTGADISKKPQFLKVYRVLKPIIKGKPVQKGQLKLIAEMNNGSDPDMKGKFNPNTFEFGYYDTNNKQVNVHLDEDGNFQDGIVKFMKVAKKEKWKETTVGKGGKTTVTIIDTTKPSEFTQERQFKAQVDKKTIIGTPFVAGQLIFKPIKNNAKDLKLKSGEYNPEMYEFTYLNKDGTPLKIHLDKDATFQNGHVKLMRQQYLPESEQTAIELQAEHGGFVEFETPKWFRDWDELKMRIDDAVKMTQTISNSTEITDPIIIKALGGVDKAKGQSIRKWPFDTKNLKYLTSTNRSLVVKIVDPLWYAKIQASESIPLSQYSDVLTKHYGAAYAKKFSDPAYKIFNAAYDGSALKNKPKTVFENLLNKSLFQNLIGFLEVILNYIYEGQTEEMYSRNSDKAVYSKAAFHLMARTNFASMYKDLLSADEKTLFNAIVNDKNNPIMKEIEGPINIRRLEILNQKKAEKTNPSTKPSASELKDYPIYWDYDRWKPIKLTRESTLFFNKVGTKPKIATFGPKIYDWLVSIIGGTDKLTPSHDASISASQGVRNVQNKPGDKDYKLAQFEVRGGPSLPASGWVNYVKNVFDAAKERGGDTPDDPSTAGKNEASKTGLKK
ncbi:MAG: DUF4157 domain-containing protein [Bacteroidetes bacterium]|nr:DUF4157 domain-containing protein [Bacteroidota bacterium]